MPSSPPLFGLALAGGQSERMGRDKAGLEIDGRPLVERAYETLQAVCGEVFVSLRPDQKGDALFKNLPAIPDVQSGHGPMSGVLAAFAAHPPAAWLVLACDLPYANAGVVGDLVRQRDPQRMGTAFIASDGFFEPLCAIYEPAMGPYLAGRASQGAHSLRHALTDADVRLLTPPGDRALVNVNTPEAYAVARQALEAGAEGD